MKILLKIYGGFFDWDHLNKRLEELEQKSQDETLWNKPEIAQKILQEREQVFKKIDNVKKITTTEAPEYSMT